MVWLKFLNYFLFLSICFNVLSISPLKFRKTRDISDSHVNYRLPNNTKPAAYYLSIKTNIAESDFDFHGQVRIKINILESTEQITLHQHGLKIHSTRLTSETGKYIDTKSPKYDSDKDFIIFETIDRILVPGQIVFLIIKYQGTLSVENLGFYRSSYYDDDMNQRWIAITQFGRTFARNAFPCYDEPSLKATFDIQIKHNSNYTVISNMPEADRTIRESKAITRFERTPLISTYLIAFVVSNFKFKEKINKNGFKYRVFAQPEKIEDATFALNEADKLHTAISEYLNMNFTWPKIDQIALPDVHELIGAMENWGLVTYRESNLLYDVNYHYDAQMWLISSTMSHQLTHQWFGNLVTPMWFNYFWLKEGMAMLFGYSITDLVHPEWNMMEHFIIGIMLGSMVDDSSSKSTPMSYYTENQSYINNISGPIIFGKSPSVLRMFMHTFTENSFRKGLKYYLTNNAYKSVTETNLFDSLQQAVTEDGTLDKDLSVHEIFSSWSNQQGFPLLIITRNYSDNTIRITQEKYTDEPENSKSDLASWWIPYNFDTASNVAVNDTVPNGWLPKGIKSTIIKPTKHRNWSSNDWVLFNRQLTGYYRILYDERNYRLILGELKYGDDSKIHPFNQAQLINDLGYFVRSGRLPYRLFFDFVKYLNRVTEAVPWVLALSHLQQMERNKCREIRKYDYLNCDENDVSAANYYGYGRFYIINPSFRRKVMERAGKIACQFDKTLCE